jgi:hypothetical protein
MDTNDETTMEWAREAAASMFARCIETAARERQRQARELVRLASAMRKKKDEA